MGLLAKVVERVSDHPVLFIFFRSLLENQDFIMVLESSRACLQNRRENRVWHPVIPKSSTSRQGERQSHR